MMQVAFVLKVQGQGSNSLHMEYLRKKSTEYCSGVDVVKLATELEAQLESLPLSTLGGIQRGRCDDVPPCIFREAQRFTTEAAVHTWIVSQNVMQGIAPPSKKVCEYRRGLQRIMEDVHTDDAHSLSLLAGEKKWAQRFRVRWDLTVGKLSAGDVVPVPELRKKVLRA
jgi:hypothetical protein